MDELENRIFKAYHKYYDNEVFTAPEPCHSIHYVSYKGYDYAVLYNINGVLAVYRIKDDDSLKQMNRYWFEKYIYTDEHFSDRIHGIYDDFYS